MPSDSFPNGPKAGDLFWEKSGTTSCLIHSLEWASFHPKTPKKTPCIWFISIFRSVANLPAPFPPCPQIRRLTLRHYWTRRACPPLPVTLTTLLVLVHHQVIRDTPRRPALTVDLHQATVRHQGILVPLRPHTALRLVDITVDQLCQHLGTVGRRQDTHRARTLLQATHRKACLSNHFKVNV